MKSLYFTLIFSIFISYCFSQDLNGYIGFDDSTYLEYIFIDTNSNPNNIWQVGAPNKPNFTSAKSLPNAIVTDTINPYPENDTSTFIIEYSPWQYPASWQSTSLTFSFRIDADAPNDYGYIEFSPDLGQTWINFMTDSIYNDCYYISHQYFTGYSESWVSAEYYLFPYCLGLWYPETIMYKFTFISDNIESNGDGWMIDNIDLFDIYEGTEEYNSNYNIKIFPIPTSTLIKITSDIDLIGCEVNIYNQFGQLIECKNLEQNSIPVSGLRNGLYVLGIMTDQGEIRRKFIIAR